MSTQPKLITVQAVMPSDRIPVKRDAEDLDRASDRNLFNADKIDRASEKQLTIGELK